MVGFVYLIVGIPGAWVLWHIKLYKNVQRNSATGWIFAMLFMMVNIGWGIASAIAPQYNATEAQIYIASSGFWAASSISNKGYGKIAAVYLVGGILWSLETAVSMYALRAAYRRYKGRGHSDAQIGLVVAGSAGRAGGTAAMLA